MRKTVGLIIIIAAALMIGCSDGEDEGVNVNTSATNANAAPPAAATPSTSTVDIQKLSSAGKSKAGGIDQVNGRPTSDPAFGKIDSKQATDIAVSGWVIDEQSQKPAEGVFISIDGKEDFPASYGVDRKDVADYFKNGAIRYSGFNASIPVSKIEKGRHSLSLKIVKGDKSGYYESERKVNIEVQ